MSSNESTPDQDLQAWRERSNDFQRRAQSHDNILSDPKVLPRRYLEIDVDDLIGAKGRTVPLPAEPFPSGDAEDGYTYNSGLIEELMPERLAGQEGKRRFPYSFEERYGREGYVESVVTPLLGQLAARQADRIADDLGKAVDELREPLRTVTAARFYNQLTSAELAGELGTSAESIEFLSEVALDQLAARLRFE